MGEMVGRVNLPELRHAQAGRACGCSSVLQLMRVFERHMNRDAAGDHGR